jgi:hypothetical protein
MAPGALINPGDAGDGASVGVKRDGRGGASSGSGAGNSSDASALARWMPCAVVAASAC